MDSRKKFILFLFFLIVSIAMGIFSGYSSINLESLGIYNFISANYWYAAFLYVIIFIVLASFSFSVSFLTSIGVIFLSGYEVVIYALIGIMASSIIHFYISRKLGKEYVKNYIEKRGGNLERFDKVLEKDTFKTILILSAVFFVPPIIPNFLGGIMNIDLKKYFIVTFLGNIPNTVLTVYMINGFLYSNNFEIYVSIIGLVIVSLTALYFYSGEIKDIFYLSFPWILKSSTPTHL